MDYPNNLRTVRTQEGLKITELSRLSKVSDKTIRDIELGKILSTQVTKQKIVNGLNNNSSKSKKWVYKDVFGQMIGK
jgi:transcriptional regulator with XRE-family HTH domain